MLNAVIKGLFKLQQREDFQYNEFSWKYAITKPLETACTATFYLFNAKMDATNSLGA